jgi:hypothetical protein
VQNAELAQHLSALKVRQSFNARTSRQILQEIAKEIPNLSKGSNLQPRISETHQTEEYTFEGTAPSTGVHTADGKLFCGTYSPNRWFSDNTKPFRDQIIELRNKHGRGSNRNKGNRGNGQAKEATKRQLQELKTQNEELTRKLSALKSDGDKSNEKDIDTKEHNAGNAFGGKHSMKK